MRTLMVNLLAAVAMALFAPAALAQNIDRPASTVPAGMEGAGGLGGAGGGGPGRASPVVAVREVDRNSACAIRARLSQDPALDPTRRVIAIDCTKPFDFMGRGNICCI